MNGRLSAAALIAKHGDRVASVAADSVHNSQRKTAMSQSSMVNKTSYLLLTLCVLCLFLSTGCALSKNMLGKSTLQNPALPTQTATSPGTANPDCAVPNSQPKATERTAYPVAPQTVQATANVAPVNNGTPQQPMMQQPAAQQQQYVQQQPVMQQPQYVQQQPVMQQPQYVQQQPVMQQPQYVQQQSTMQQQQPAVPQQYPAFVQQPAQQPLAQPMAQMAVVTTATQGQDQTGQLQQNQQQAAAPQAAPAMVAEIAPVPDQYQTEDPNAASLPPATITLSPNHPKQASRPDMTAAPASAHRAQARTGVTVAPNCPPGMVPNLGYMADEVSPPEKLAECEKQVFEMNQKLSELQLDTRNAKWTIGQMAEQQKQLLIDNERLRRRAEMADKRYLEELDSLSEIVGEVVSQAGTGNQSSSAGKPSRGANPKRPVSPSATGQSL